MPRSHKPWFLEKTYFFFPLHFRDLEPWGNIKRTSFAQDADAYMATWLMPVLLPARICTKASRPEQSQRPGLREAPSELFLSDSRTWPTESPRSIPQGSRPSLNTSVWPTPASLSSTQEVAVCVWEPDSNPSEGYQSLASVALCPGSLQCRVPGCAEVRSGLECG